MPLAKDGILYYSASYSKVFAVKGDTGEMLWSFIPKLDDETRRPPDPLALQPRHGDGRRQALHRHRRRPPDRDRHEDRQTGLGYQADQLAEAHRRLYRRAAGGQGQGDHRLRKAASGPCRGPIFGVDAKTGQKVWEFDTVGGTPEAEKTWGNESWRTGGGGGWMPGTYDAETNTVWWGTANPAPLYDWSGSDWKTEGARPGDNLYTTSVIALDPDTGKLKSYHQELPHDAWDFDSAVGEFVPIDRGGKKYYRASQQERLRLRLRPRRCAARSRTSTTSSKPATSSKTSIRRPASCIGRRDMTEGKQKRSVPGDRRRDQLECRDLQPADRPLLQGRQ